MQSFTMRSLREGLDGKKNLNSYSTYVTMIVGKLEQGGLFMASVECRSQTVL